jgi:hypothetical protein
VATATAGPAQTFSYAQLEQLWINAGGTADTAPIAAAIAEAESGGVSNRAYPSTYVTPGQGSATDATGLWQILGPPAGFTAAQLTDPSSNAAMAVAKYQQAGNSFTPWVTYTNGAYLASLSSGTTPDPNVPGGGTTAATLTAAQQAGSTTCLIGFNTPSVLGLGGGTVCILSKAQMRNIAGSALIVGGGVLVLAGLVLIVGIGLGQSQVRRLAGPAVEGLATGIGERAALRKAAAAPASGRHAKPEEK